MILRASSLMVTIGLIGWVSLGQAAELPAAAVRIPALLDQLGSKSFQEREAAQRELLEIGAPALEQLRGVLSNDDAEIRRRSAALVKRIEQIIDTQLILTPTPVHLVCKNMRVEDALKQLTNQTGVALRIDSPPAERSRLEARTITLDTGSTTFWEALERLCLTSGLTRKEVVPQPETFDPNSFNRIGKGNIPFGNYTGDAAPTSLLLVPGKVPVTPSCQSGLVLVRVLPTDSPRAHHLKEDGEAFLTLEVAAEPKLRLQAIVGLHIAKSVDDLGFSLAHILPKEPIQAVADPYQGRVYFMQANEIRDDSSSLVQIRLALPDKSAKSVRELRGTISALVLTPPLPVLCVEDLLGSAGRSIEGKDGAKLKILAIEQGKNGIVDVNARWEALPAKPDFPLMMRRIRIRRRVIDSSAVGLSGEFKLFDNRGREIPRVENVVEAPVSDPRDIHLSYRLNTNQEKIGKLVAIAQRTVVIDIPFVLENVPLP